MLTAIALLGAMMVLPGAGIALAVYRPGTISLPLRIGLAVGFGFAVPAGLAYVLAAAHLLYPVIFIGTLIATTAIGWGIAIRRGRFSDHARSIANEARSEGWGLAAGLVVVTALAAVHTPLLARFEPSIPFPYYSDGMQFAVEHDIPEVSLDYGSFYEPTANKVLVNAFNGATSLLIPNPAVVVNVLAWFAAVLTAIALWVLGRTLGLRYTAALLPVLVIAAPDFLNGEWMNDLNAYRAEPFVRPVALVAMAAGILVIRRGNHRDLAVTALMFAATAAGHLISAMAAAMFFASYAVVYLVVRHRLSEVYKVARNGLIVGAVAAALVVVMVIGSNGDMALQGTGAKAPYTLLKGRYDPTLYLKTGGLQPLNPPENAFYLPPGQIVGSYFDSSTGAEPQEYVRPRDGVKSSSPAQLAVLLVLLVVAVAQLLWVRDDRRLLGLTSWLFGAMLVAAALVFSFRYDFWILASAGVRRFFDYSALPVAVWGLSLVDIGIGRFASKRSFAALPVVLAIAVLVLLLPGRPALRAEEAHHRSVLSWVRENLPCDSRLLANTRTTGVFEALTGRVSLSEGMGPFLRPAMLGRLMNLMAEIRAFYREPAENRELLERNGVGYVLALKKKSLGYGAGMPKADVQSLDETRYLRPLVNDPAFAVFEVVPPPRVENLPGTWARCPSTPLKPDEPFER
jgi:hypothetical protein